MKLRIGKFNKKMIIVILTFIVLLLIYISFLYYKPLSVKIFGGKKVSDIIEKNKIEMKHKYDNLDSLTDGKDIILLVLKEERIMELWKRRDTSWVYTDTFEFTNFSGELGPKLEEGDKQIPEGIYKIEYLNPNSRFNLSMKINYPNKFDREKAKEDNRSKLGNDIFIHGDNSTIGCIPIGDRIEELFYIIAENGFTNTNVIISPYDMRRTDKKIKYKQIDWLEDLYSDIKKEIVKLEKKHNG